ncbi:STAS domain-containing protein [Amycolatopsis sp. YIM 10]|uniref:STAS domain-containing protein n=1 Tax=Amycolatopsis sp. YIM 10 TaxID=2653857 RepID=UPI00128FD137|nr:STAS domain-containing protein [Amycolatopsis sp. YIM 10]QFU86643.1 Anti-sigma-F factor antagonist RsfB [Amycolatopsis sp. YIM 10]
MFSPDPVGVVTDNAGGVVLTFTGDIVLVTAPAADVLAGQAHDRAATSTRKLLVIDLREVTFLASVGTTVLMIHRRRAGRTGVKITVVANTPRVTRVLDLSGLTSHFRVHADLETALAP